MGDDLPPIPSNFVNSATPLSPLPPVLTRGLAAVTTLGLLSFLTSTGLILHLVYRIATWKRAHRHGDRDRSKRHANQFIILIFNLILADLQQSIAFTLNIQWLIAHSIGTGTSTCWAQGWFVSTGDLASGVFTFAIAVHAFLDIVFNIRFSHLSFVFSVLGLWSFSYTLAIIGVATHPHDFYIRAGAWCWINVKYTQSRFWLHYFYLIVIEFGALIMYTAIFVILRYRIRNSHYRSTPQLQLHAQSAAKMIVAYPIVYVVCTLPLVIARLKTMAGLNVSLLEFCIAGAMITSNGWLDVVLYCVTRRGLIFGPEVGDESVRALDTFNWSPSGGAFGNRTTIEAVRARKYLHRRSESLECFAGKDTMTGVTTETTVEVTGEIVALEVLERMKRLQLEQRESASGGDLLSSPKTRGESWHSELYDRLQFITEKSENLDAARMSSGGATIGESGRDDRRDGT